MKQMINYQFIYSSTIKKSWILRVVEWNFPLNYFISHDENNIILDLSKILDFILYCTYTELINGLIQDPGSQEGYGQKVWDWKSLLNLIGVYRVFKIFFTDQSPSNLVLLLKW